MKPEIKCPECKGSGRIRLPIFLMQTLYMIPKGGSVTATELAKTHRDVAATAFNNRLERLRLLGFATRERDGKFWRYSRA